MQPGSPTAFSPSSEQVEYKASLPTPHALGDAARQTLHDVILVEMEQHSPEGVEHHGTPPWIRRAALLAAVAVVVGALVLLGVLAGPPAVGLGLMIVLALYTVGVGPEWAAARVRRLEMKGFEQRIEAKISRLERRAARHLEPGNQMHHA